MIPRRIGHIWIGPRPAPVQWMQTWRDAHPGMEYQVYGNDFLLSRRFRNQALLVHYFERREYAGVADILRYEILFEDGGVLPEADSICVTPIDPLLDEGRPWTCFEIDPAICDQHGMPRKKGLLCPILASPKAHPVLDALIDHIAATPITPDLPTPWKVTGNYMLRAFFRKRPQLARQITVFPAHYFVPEHYRGPKYAGPGPIYARQLWGTTTQGYVEREAAAEPGLLPTHEDLLEAVRARL